MSDQNNNKELSLKRYAARIAMEGEAEKARREAEEKAYRDIELATETAKQKELDQKAAEERAIKDKKEAEEREKRGAAIASEEIKSEVNKIKSVGTQIGSLRTLKSDMDRIIKDQSISLARIAMEEDSRKRIGAGTENGQNIKNWTMIIASIILISSGLGVGGYLYFKYLTNTTTIETPIAYKQSKTPIIIENQKELPLSGLSSDKIISEIKKTVSESIVANGSIQKINLTKISSTGEKVELNSQEFFSALRSSAPGDLIRSLNPEITLGVLNTVIGAKSGFIIFTAESYKNAFAGMLKWEKGSFVKDIYEIITSTPANDFLTTKDFEDIIINNQDTRVLKNENGEIVLIYGFLNGQDLIITGRTSVFEDLVTRFRNSPNK